ISTGVKRDVKGIPSDWIGDTDHDGILAAQDKCPDSNLDLMITVDGCNSSVRNQLFNDGCTITDKVASCAKSARNHGQFVSCVAQLTNNRKQNGTISASDKGKIQACAAQANIP